MALPSQQGHIGLEINEYFNPDHHAPADEDIIKPIRRTWKDYTDRNQVYNETKYNLFRGLPQQVAAQQWTVQTQTVSYSNMTVSRKSLKKFWTIIQFSQGEGGLYWFHISAG